MKVVFFMSHGVFARNFEWTLRLLAERGHDLVVALDAPTDQRGRSVDEPLASIAAAHPNVRVVASPRPRPRRRPSSLAGVLARRWLDYLRYLEPPYDDVAALRARARAAAVGSSLVPETVLRRSSIRRGLRRAFTLAERRLPLPREVLAFLASERPCVVLVTPVVDLGSPQTEYLRAAHRCRIPTLVPVASWDNLTVKGALHELPNRIAVWNETQRREAVELHGLPRDRIVVTGAVAYDHWFDWTPSRDRASFCSRVGLDPRRPYVLYLCSSPFAAPDEAAHIVAWASALRASTRLRDVQALVREHPQSTLESDGLHELARLDGVAVYPPGGRSPVDAASRADYFDSIHHSAAVTGVNTSGFIESSIVGRPVHALLSRRYRGSQEQTLHFHYLLEANGGPVRVAASFGEHERQLEEALATPPEATRGRALPFLERFVRPFGLGEPASPRLVAAVEELASGRRTATIPEGHVSTSHAAARAP